MCHVVEYILAFSPEWVWRVRVEQGWETNKERVTTEIMTEPLEEF